MEVSIDGATVRIGGARVQTADVSASNGVVHVIGSVLTGGLNVVERARVTPELSTLVTAVVEGGLAATLEGPGPVTRDRCGGAERVLGPGRRGADSGARERAA